MTSERPTTPMLILVVGAGRSGTSTAAGTLRRLGFAVPQPEVPADETNPRGFYEPQWVVDFHRRVLGEVAVRTNDARPEAVAKTAELSGNAALLDELTAWLAPLAAEERVVVKDPRTFWLLDLWRKAAGNAGFELAYLTMLRHPAAVVRSRDTHYLAGKDAEFRRARETTNVAAWCHGTMVTERSTRSERRAFVLYRDLMTDWRATMRRVEAQLGTSLMAGVTDAPHPVDDFIDTGLNRSEVGWEVLSAHGEVRELGEHVWDAAYRLVLDPADTAAQAALDELHERYDLLYQFARDLTRDQTSTEREAHRAAQRQLRGRIAELERHNAELSDQLEAARRSLTNRVVRRLRRH